MQVYEIIVSGRAVQANSADTTLVRTSIGIDMIHVLFDNEEWTDFPVRVTFANGNTLVSTSLTLAEIDAPEWAAEAECAIPWEVIQDLGGIRITFQGTDASGNHIITEASGTPLTVVEAGDVGSGTVPSPAPSVDEWNQAYANAMAAANSASGAAESATEAADRANTAAAGAEQVLEDGIPLMDDDTRGGAKLGDGLEVDENEALNLSTMSATQHGGATLGSGLRVDDGALSLGDLVQSGSGAEVVTDGCAIYSVEGDGWSEQESTTGKNLAYFPTAVSGTTTSGLSYLLDGNRVTASGTITAANQTSSLANLDKPIKMLAGQTYVFSLTGKHDGTGYTRWLFYDAQGSMIADSYTSTTNTGIWTVTPSTDIDVYGLKFRASTSNASYDIDGLLQVEAGSTATAYEPYTGGKASPSPDYPQEIRVARGRNLFTRKFENMIVNNNGSVAVSTGVNVYVAAVERNTDYVVSAIGKNRCNVTKVPSENISGGMSGTSLIISNASANTFNSGDADYVAVYLCSTGAESECQLELGSTPTPYVPYGHVGLEVHGRNLIKNPYVDNSKTSAGITWTVNQDGSITANGTATNISVFILNNATMFGEHEPGTYTISGTPSATGCRIRMQYDNGSGGSASVDSNAGASTTFTVSSPLRIASGNNNLFCIVESGRTVNNLVFRPQIERGNTAHGYQPYSHTTTTIPLPAKGFAGALPDGTADALTVDSAGRWEWVNESDEVVLNGTQSFWSYDWRSTSGTSGCQIVLPTAPKSPSSATVALPSYASRFPIRTHDKLYNADYDTGFAFPSNNTAKLIELRVNESGINTVALWQTWLQSHPVTVLYPLATPTTEHGYIDLPALPSGATVSIPELEQIGVSWFVDGCEPIVEHAANIKPATESRIGGVKPDGTTITVDEDGVISAVGGGGGGGGGYVLPPATSSTLGGVKVGSNLTVGQDGTLSAAAPYTLPNASSSTLGGVKVGNGLAIDANGVLSLDVANGDGVSY